MIARLSVGGGQAANGGSLDGASVRSSLSLSSNFNPSAGSARNKAKPQKCQLSASQLRRKRANLLDLLLNTNWSKQSHQANNLIKLNKILLVCDANFLDEKSGESPLSLAISSPQINVSTVASSYSSASNSSRSSGLSSATPPLLACPQSGSLFDLQSHSTSANVNQFTLKQTSLSDLIQSRAPLVERIVLLLVKSGASIDFRNQDGKTPLHVAASKSNFWALNTLLDLGASTDYRDINGLTPLYYSILHKADLKVTQLLLNYSNQQSYAGNNSISLYRLLHQTGGNSNFDGSLTSNDSANSSGGGNCDETGSGSSGSCIGVTDQLGWQELHQACKLGLDAHLDKLLYFGCDINAKISGSGNTPLHVAAINDQINCAKVLLMRGADKTITNNSHQTAYQVAVIANNMDLAEFISEFDETKLVPFLERPPNYVDMSGNRSPGKTSGKQCEPTSTMNSSFMNHNRGSSSLVSSQSTMSMQAANSSGAQLSYHHQQISRPPPPQPPNVGIVQPQYHALSGDASHQFMMNPLVLDIQNALNPQHSQAATSGSCATSGSAGQMDSGSLLSIGGAGQQLNVQVNNISPCLSQRSCATSNTTSSSGVCCDGDGTSHLNEDIHYGNSQPQATKPSISQSRHPNITVISIGNKSTVASGSNNSTLSRPADGRGQTRAAVDETNHESTNSTGASAKTMLSVTGASTIINGSLAGDGHHDENDDEEDLKSSGSGSSNSSSTIGLCSLISEERPLYAGTIVEATSEYQSGDPSHLQLHRGDLIEVLECKSELLLAGQLPRLANKPMIYGKRISDGQCGLFPSFCAQRRAKSHHRQSLRQRLAMAELSNQLHNQSGAGCRQTFDHHQQAVAHNIRGTNMPESQSMVAIDKKSDTHNEPAKWYPTSTFGPTKPFEQQQHQPSSRTAAALTTASVPALRFKELQVRLRKANEGFGFVLRGARINPATLTTATIDAANNGSQQTPTNGTNKTSGSIVIDERLMAANNLASLQYLDEIESGSVAHQAGLKRGDFLVAVNQRDVRLCSHEQVVQMIRQSGNEVLLTIATPTQVQSQQANSASASATPTAGISKPLVTKVKPEPPKRDPNTTLTRNKSQRVNSMIIGGSQSMIAPRQVLSEFPQFDANKPLPSAPAGDRPPLVDSPTGSLNVIGRSISTNLSQFHSAQSLASPNSDFTSDAPSISSLSTAREISAGGQQSLSGLPQQHSQLLSSQPATPNHSSSSTTTLTTVATMKPQPPAKPSSITGAAGQRQHNQHQPQPLGYGNNLAASKKSAIYQPAVITTTTKRSSQLNSSPTTQQQKQLVSPQRTASFPPPPDPALNDLRNEITSTATKTAIVNPSTINTTPSQLQAPPPPPPPPLLPSSANLISSPTQSTNRLSQRRTSAPINQVARVSDAGGGNGDLLKASRLLKKRESLATIGQAASSGQQQVPVPAQFSEVAAACAAAANSRMQRRQQQVVASEQSQQTGQVSGGNQANSLRTNGSLVQATTTLSTASATEVSNKESEITKARSVVTEHAGAPVTKVMSDNDSDVVAHQKGAIIQQFDRQPKTAAHEPPVLYEKSAGSPDKRQQSATCSAVDNHRQFTKSSATLCRSSAQVIQQPKNQHSQTLRVTSRLKQRPTIPNFDDLPPPPPPLPLEPLQTVAVNRLDSGTQQLHQQQHQQRCKHHHQHSHHHPAQTSESLYGSAAVSHPHQQLYQQQVQHVHHQQMLQPAVIRQQDQHFLQHQHQHYHPHQQHTIAPQQYQAHLHQQGHAPARLVARASRTPMVTGMVSQPQIDSCRCDMRRGHEVGTAQSFVGAAHPTGAEVDETWGSDLSMAVRQSHHKSVPQQVLVMRQCCRRRQQANDLLSAQAITAGPKCHEQLVGGDRHGCASYTCFR